MLKQNSINVHFKFGRSGIIWQSTVVNDLNYPGQISIFLHGVYGSDIPDKFLILNNLPKIAGFNFTMASHAGQFWLWY